MKIESLKEYLDRGGEIKRCEIRETTHKEVFSISGKRSQKPTKEEIKKSKQTLIRKGII